MDCEHISFTKHALERMFQRGIDDLDVALIVRTGAVIHEYPDTKPFPKFIMLGTLKNEFVHVVIAHDPETRNCFTITVYWPDPELWSDDFRTRRT